MKKLVNFVEIVENNENCVILEVVGTPFDLIRLGCFNGDEKMFRLTKGDKHTCTVWTNDGKNYSWHWGIGGHTLVSSQTEKQGKLIQECIEQDFEICIRGRKENIRKTLYIKSLEDIKHMSHNIKLMYFDYGDVCCHIDGEYFKHFSNLHEGIAHFERKGYLVTHIKDEVAVTGCMVKHYSVKR